MSAGGLIYLPDAIKQLASDIADKEWDGQLVTENNYAQLARWQQMVKDGNLYEPAF